MPRKRTTFKKPKMIHVRLSEDLHQKLRIHVASKKLTIQDLVEKLIENNIKHKPRKLS